MADRKTAILDAAIGVIARRGIRGLRVEEVAAEAGVAVSLLYYHFDTRDGLVRATLDQANERAAATPGEATDAASGYDAVLRTLLGEFEPSPRTRDSSVVWGEILASAVFEPALREQVRAAGEAWIALVGERIAGGQRDGSVRAGVDVRASAERLTALVDGLSARWLAGALELERARELLGQAVAVELSP